MTNNFANELVNILKEYTDEVEDGLEKEKDKVTREGVKKLKVISPKKTGAYAKSWGRRKIGTARIIRNAKHYQLTHLLEKGHAKVGGGRVEGRPHIRPVEQEIVKNYEKGVERVIKG